MYIIIIMIIDISWLKLNAMAELVSMNTFFRCLVWSWLILIEDLAQALVWFCTCFWLQAWQKILFHTDMMCIKNFRALSDSAVNSVLLFSQKLLKLSFLKSICTFRNYFLRRKWVSNPNFRCQIFWEIFLKT